ncbi:hypothetical protein Tco_1486018, partial [Tanacetum coccineum]
MKATMAWRCRACDGFGERLLVCSFRRRRGPGRSEDESVHASVHEVGESSTAPFLREDSDGLLPSLIRRDINSLFGRMASLLRR